MSLARALLEAVLHCESHARRLWVRRPRWTHDLNQYLSAGVTDPARLDCSVCFGGSNIGCRINGAHLISWCGQFFSGKEEQRILAELLKEFMDRTKWPNQTCYERLEQIWPGTRRSWAGT
ncbi:hypothetical protein VUR80DRAFT_3329 [Thermomyces stellatus]